MRMTPCSQQPESSKRTKYLFEGEAFVLKIHQYLFLIFLVMKPFYLFPSGGLQLSDLFFIFSLLCYTIIIRGGERIEIDWTDKWLLYFVCFVLAINVFYAVIYGESVFIKSSMYYVYNALIVVIFRIYASDAGFLWNVERVCKANLLIQLLIYVAGLGRNYTADRYMGTFNDPNQMAFFIFMSLITAVIITKIRHSKLNVFYHLLAIGLIFQTSSTGMLLAITVFYTVQIAITVTKVVLRTHSVNFILASTVILMMAVLFSSKIDDALGNLVDSPIISRVEEKLSRQGTDTYATSNITDRGIDKLVLYPEKTLFGAGEGLHYRFEQDNSVNEIHSTLFSILFYYGVVPALLFLVWCMKNIHALSIGNIAAVLALVIESITLLNQRQPLFWMFFVLLDILYRQEYAEGSVAQKEFLSGVDQSYLTKDT